MDEPLAAPSAILYRGNTAALKEGSVLVENIVLGRLLGSGMQARVYELVLSDGRPTGKVVKIAHKDLGHKAINAVWISMAREWELGLKLRAALQQDDGQLPGFMRVCDAILSASNGPGGDRSVKGRGRGRAHFAGMVLEKLDGWEVYKRIEQPEFHNIHYVREMLRQVFTALDRAQRETGFFHADMGMRNVMEHYPELYEEEAADQLQRSIQRASEASRGRPRARARSRHRSAEDYETSPGALPDRELKSSEVPSEAAAEVGSGGPRLCDAPAVQVSPVPTAPGDKNLPPKGAGGDAAREGAFCTFEGSGRIRARPGFTCNANGSRMPLGPRVEFRVIDYGSSYFSQTLAQATGGFKARQTYEHLANMFERERIVFAARQGNTLVEMETAGIIPIADDEDEEGIVSWLQQRASKGRRGRVKRGDMGGAVSTSDGGLEPAERLHSNDTMGRAGIEASHVQASMPQKPSSPALPRPPAARQTPIEKMYRTFWRRKGDVFHIMLNLAIVLDDRVWPKEDEDLVLLFVSLVHHVTGVKMKASFASEVLPGSDSVWGRLRHNVTGRGKWEHYGSRTVWYSWFRRNHIRFKSHFYPYNSGLTAGEALVAPFFGQEESLEVPRSVPLSEVFPRSS